MKKKVFKKVLIYLMIILVVLIMDFPFIVLTSKAFNPDKELTEYEDTLVNKLKLDNFVVVLLKSNFSRNILNSIIVSFATTLFCLIISTLGGYTLSRYKGRIFNSYSLLLFVLQMFPLVLLLIPLFITFRLLNIQGLMTVIISYIAFSIPFSTWMLKSFFDTIPFDIEEAAFIDGCNEFSSLYKIILPISLPGMAAVGIFVFIMSWSEFMLASIFLTSDTEKTLTVGIQLFRQEYYVSWGLVMAAAFIAVIPSFIMLVFAQKYLVRGLTSAAVKG